MNERVREITSEKGLSIQEVLQEPCLPRRRYWVGSVSDRSGREGTLKVLISPERVVRRKFRTEVSFLENAGSPLIPRLYQYGADWCFREFVSGSFGGDICSDFGFARGFFDSASINKLAREFQSLRSTSSAGSEKHGYLWYKRDFDFYKSSLETVSLPQLEKIERFIRSRKHLLDDGCRFVSHGDLYPGNFVKEVSGNIRIIDWELLHLNNAAFDPAFVGMLLWQEPLLRDHWLSHFETTDNFREHLAVCQVSLAVRFIRHSEIMLEHFIDQSEAERRKLARAALESHREGLEKCLGKV